MKTPTNNSVITGVQSLGWAFIALIEGVILYGWVVVEGLVEPEVISGSTGLFLYGIVNAICCFFIVFYCPRSVWFVPFIINTFLIALTFWEPHFWNTSLWVPVCSGWALCIVSSIAGALAGDKTTISPHRLERIGFIVTHYFPRTISFISHQKGTTDRSL
ncbi:MAG TPA: hypothetical protein DCL77_16255 [Prolixibacteraceae bacterium]|jgi:hypothetical protein|nr:hypothetical protein [Prolixibacteraceae bacterium]